MNKKEFVEEVAKRCMVTTYVVDEIYNVSSGLIVERLLNDEKVEVPKLGKFSTKERGSITYKNLFGQDSRTVDGYVYPHFQVANGIKCRVKNGVKYPKNH